MDASFAIEPGTRVLILHDLGGYTEAVVVGHYGRREEWATVRPILPGKYQAADRQEPLRRLTPATDEARAVARRAAEHLERGLKTVAEAHEIASALPRLHLLNDQTSRERCR